MVILLSQSYHSSQRTLNKHLNLPDVTFRQEGKGITGIAKHCSINVLLTYFLTKGSEFLFSFHSPLSTFIMPATTAETTSIFLQWLAAPSLLVQFQKNSAFCIVFLSSRAQFLKMLLRGRSLSSPSLCLCHPPFSSHLLHPAAKQLPFNQA